MIKLQRDGVVGAATVVLTEGDAVLVATAGAGTLFMKFLGDHALTCTRVLANLDKISIDNQLVIDFNVLSGSH